MSAAPPMWVVTVPGGNVDVDLVHVPCCMTTALHVAAFNLHLEPADVPVMIAMLDRVVVKNDAAPACQLVRGHEITVSRGADTDHVWICSGDAYLRLRQCVAEGVLDALRQLHQRLRKFGHVA